MNDSQFKPENLPKPTDAEVEILSILWARGPSAVREVHDEISANGRPIGYTTVLKQMQMMFEKGLLRRDESNRAHVYAAAIHQEQTQRQLVGDLLDKAFAGSAMNLVMQALATKRASAEELSQIRELLDQHERSGQ
ncbi:MAG: BlaI/MecI/CopY family transcriptional regulator [Pyrinomonadaceae bacterium]